jgi:hypothetical protein
MKLEVNRLCLHTIPYPTKGKSVQLDLIAELAF